MVPSVSSERGGRAGSATSLPVPGHQPKAENTSSFFGIGTCADAEAPKVTSTRVASDTGATIPRLFGGPRAAAQSATKISRRIACNKLVRCASPGQVNQQFAMADGFDNRCLSCSERWRDAFGRLSFEDFGAHANTTAGAEDLAQYENTKAGTEPDWIPEDVLVETSTRVCLERSVLVLTAADYRKEMEKPLPGAGGLNCQR